MKKLAVVISSLVALSPQFANAENYIGLKLGHSWMDDSCVAGGICDDKSLAGGVFGGITFNDHLAAEMGFDNLGSFDTSFDGGQELESKFTALTIAPKLNIPLSDFDLYGKLGAALVSFDSGNDWTLMGALGAEYAIKDNLSARLEYQRINNVEDAEVDGVDIDSVFLGLAYTFGKTQALPAAEPELEPLDPVIEEEVQPKPMEEVKEEPLAVVAEPEPIPETKLFQEYGTELFDHNSFALAEGSEQYFDWLVGVMKKFPQAEAEIVGHTDSRGSEEYNQALSEKRAQSVADYLYSQGIEESRVTVRGAGESEPKASNETAEGRMENRRVEVTINEFEYQE